MPSHFVPEDAVLTAARARAVEIGVEPISAATGAALQLLAAATRARTAVEIGTDTGVSGLYLLRGMPDGVLTSIDPEAEAQRLARAAFNADGIPTSKARLINGRALDVLPRLTDGAYDIVFCASDRREYPDCAASGGSAGPGRRTDHLRRGRQRCRPVSARRRGRRRASPGRDGQGRRPHLPRRAACRSGLLAAVVTPIED